MSVVTHVGPGQYLGAGVYASTEEDVDPSTGLPGYATASDVRTLLGVIGNRLPDVLSIDTQLLIARAEVAGALHNTYGERLPNLTGKLAALETLRWAEAKLAAAGLLSALLVMLPQTERDIPSRLRSEARQVLTRALPDVDPSAGPDPDGDGPQKPVQPVSLAVSHASIGSAFPNPYAAPYGHNADLYLPAAALRDPRDLWWEA